MSNGVVKSIRESIARLIDSTTHKNAASVAKQIGRDLGLNEKFLEYTHVELRNKLNESRFKKVPYKDRMLLLPHCMRSVKKCRAKYGKEGLGLEACVKCRERETCQTAVLARMAQGLGYKKVACVPGGSMVAKLVEKHRPKAIVGVACSAELHMGLDKMGEFGIPSQAVLLLKDGCTETEASIEEVREKLELAEK